MIIHNSAAQRALVCCLIHLRHGFVISFALILSAFVVSAASGDVAERPDSRVLGEVFAECQIAEHTLHATNQRFFGLFYFADQEQLRVRNVRWRGEWPRTLPSADADELAGSDTDFLDNDSDHLQAAFQHDFSKQELPPEVFRVASGEWEKDLKLTPKGLLTQAVTSGLTVVSLGHTVGREFDIFARYTAFKGGPEGGSARLMTRLQNPRLHEVTGGRKHMIHAKDFQENVGFLWYGFYDDGPYRVQFETGQNIEETAGTVRLSRRGNTIHLLTAEDGSSNYRLHAAQVVGTEDLSAGCIRLQGEITGTSVIWKDLEIHAERIQSPRQMISSTAPFHRSLVTDVELQKRLLAVVSVFQRPTDDIRRS